ncbi:MAG: hypothetical protein WAX77_13450, partial [Methylococcaceae bacterium]
MVTGTNVVAQDESSGFLSGYFQSESSESSFAKHKIAAQTSKKDSLSLVPLAIAPTKVDPESKDTVLSVADMSIGSQNSQIVATSTTMMKDPEEDG